MLIRRKPSCRLFLRLGPHFNLLAVLGAWPVLVLPLAVWPFLVWPSRLSGAESTAGRGRDREVRGIWVTRWDYKSEEDVRRSIRWSATVGLNRVFFQVRGRADAFYRSSIEPWGEELGARDPGFDPLQLAIDEARKVGVELHAWINLLPAWKGSDPPRSPQHVFYRHPEWFLEDSTGRRHMTKAADYTILNPCLPEVRSYLVDVVTDIVSRYAVDGVQLDYARFVARDPRRDGDFPWDPRTLALFRSYSSGSPTTSPALWEKWRRLSVDTLVYLVADSVRKARLGCEVSVAVIPNYERARAVLFQDAVKWQRRGYVDAVYPMAYTTDDSAFRLTVGSALKFAAGGEVVPGIGVHLHKSPTETARQIEAARSLGTGGYCLFAFASLFPSPSHEYRGDSASRRLRSAMRSAVLATNMREPEAPQPPTRLSRAGSRAGPQAGAMRLADPAGQHSGQ